MVNNGIKIKRNTDVKELVLHNNKIIKIKTANEKSEISTS